MSSWLQAYQDKVRHVTPAVQGAVRAAQAGAATGATVPLPTGAAGARQAPIVFMNAEDNARYEEASRLRVPDSFHASAAEASAMDAERAEARRHLMLHGSLADAGAHVAAAGPDRVVTRQQLLAAMRRRRHAGDEGRFRGINPDLVDLRRGVAGGGRGCDASDIRVPNAPDASRVPLNYMTEAQATAYFMAQRGQSLVDMGPTGLPSRTPPPRVNLTAGM